jgi:hypothetical protein
MSKLVFTNSLRRNYIEFKNTVLTVCFTAFNEILTVKNEKNKREFKDKVTFALLSVRMTILRLIIYFKNLKRLIQK